MIRDESKKIIEEKGIKNVSYYDSTINYKAKFEAVIEFITRHRPWYYITETYILIYHKKDAIVISTDDNVDTLTVPDIRNKLSPITNLISLCERDDVPKDMMDRSIEGAKKSVEYLSGN